MKKLQFHLTPSLFGPIFGRMPGVKDRVAVVTGAANGLGREIALLLAREGARVALGDLDGAELERSAADIMKAGGQAVTVAGELLLPTGGAAAFLERTAALLAIPLILVVTGFFDAAERSRLRALARRLRGGARPTEPAEV